MTDFTKKEKETVPFSEQEKEFAQWLEEEFCKNNSEKQEYDYLLNDLQLKADAVVYWGMAWLLLAREVRGREWQTIHCELGKIREKIKDLYHQIGKVEVWNASNDVVCDLCEEKVDEIINEAQCELKSHFFTTSVLEVKEASVASEDESRSPYGSGSNEPSASVPPKGETKGGLPFGYLGNMGEHCDMCHGLGYDCMGDRWCCKQLIKLHEAKEKKKEMKILEDYDEND